MTFFFLTHSDKLCNHDRTPKLNVPVTILRSRKQIINCLSDGNQCVRTFLSMPCQSFKTCAPSDRPLLPFCQRLRRLNVGDCITSVASITVTKCRQQTNQLVSLCSKNCLRNLRKRHLHFTNSKVAWFRSQTQYHNTLRKHPFNWDTAKAAKNIICRGLSSSYDLYVWRMRRQAGQIITDRFHPAHSRLQKLVVLEGVSGHWLAIHHYLGIVSPLAHVLSN